MSTSLLTTEDLAERWGLSPRTLRWQRHKGKGPQYIEISDRTVLYRIEDVLAYEQGLTAGGVLPARAEAVMTKAASVLDMVAKWKIKPEAMTVVVTTRDDLLAQLKREP